MCTHNLCSIQVPLLICILFQNSEKTPAAIEKKSQDTMAQNPNVSNNTDSWQNVDMTRLMSGLDLGGADSGAVPWWDVVDHLRVKHEPRVKTMTKVRTK